MKGELYMKKFSAFKVLSMAALMTMASSFAAFAGNAGWQQSGGDWYYTNNNGDYATDTWKKSNENWFYLGGDGKMLTETLVEDGDNYYYVNSAGAMVQNEWRYIETDYTDGESRWYYFGPNGKAYKSTSSKASLKEINGKKYIFDDEGLMLYGWVDADGTMAEEDDTEAWKNATYYCGTDMDGAVTNGWISLEVDDDTESDTFQGYYWFYFNPSTGKKVTDEDAKQINGKRYGFDENGAMLYEFAEVGTSSSATASNAVDAYKYYQDYDNGANQRNGWFKAIPVEDVNPEGYDEGEEKWYYASSNGRLKASTIATINGKKYAFNEYGEMISGLVGLEMDGSKIVSYTDAIESEDDLATVEEDDKYQIYYFGDEEDGSMRKSSASVEVDGESYKYEFKTNGEGRDGIYKDVIYVKGRRVEADKDYGYQAFDAEGNLSDSGYLVNTSGKIQKNKKNLKDKDDMYYCTDAEGFVTYHDSEKFTSK